MAGYKLKRKTSNGTMVDVPLVATYDDAGNKISETYAKGSDYLPITGGTLTGNLKVGSSSIGANGYLEGTWLRTSSTANLGSAPARYCVLDPSGWVYYRTREEMIADLGISSSQSTSQIVIHYKNDAIETSFKYTPNCITRRTYLGATQMFQTLSGPPEMVPASTCFILVPKAGQGDYYCELYYMNTSGKFIKFNSTVPQGSYTPQSGIEWFIEEIMPIT